MSLLQKQQFAKQYANNYVETSISEASPHKLIEMLYEGALKHIKLIRIFMDQKNFEKKSEHMNKLLSIVLNLREGVDLKKGGEVADNLYRLYDYCYRQLVKASFKNDTVILDEVEGHLRGLSEAWKELPTAYKKLTKDQIEKMGAH